MEDIDLTSLFKYFKITNTTRQSEIKEAVQTFQNLDHAFCSLFSFQTQSFIFLAPEVQSVLGYPLNEFIKGGFELFQKITPGHYIPYIIKEQSAYIARIRKNNFNYLKPLLIYFDAALLDKHGREIKVHQASIALNFEPGGDFKTFFAVWNVTDKFSAIELKKRKAFLDIKLKEFHRLIFSPGFSGKKKNNNAATLIRLRMPEISQPALTAKEKEILMLLAKGYSLKEVAAQKKVSYFTVESHRKNLFGKFKVHNTAELIMKASKIYWLE